jgi:hypothetical protein
MIERCEPEKPAHAAGHVTLCTVAEILACSGTPTDGARDGAEETIRDSGAKGLERACNRELRAAPEPSASGGNVAFSHLPAIYQLGVETLGVDLRA